MPSSYSAAPPAAPARPRRRARVTVLGALFCLTLLCVAVCGFLVWRTLAASTNFLFSTRPDVRLIDFVGMTEADFRAGSYAARLEPVVTYANTDYPAGVICRQSPQAGRTVKEGQRLALKVSLGPNRITLPDVREKTREEPLAWLRAQGLAPVTAFTPDNTLPNDSVLGTDPAAGAVVDGGTAVTVRLSSALPDAHRTVPSLYGLTVRVAREQLESIGLRADTDAPDAALVTDQAPMAGMPLLVGKRVKLYAG